MAALKTSITQASWSTNLNERLKLIFLSKVNISVTLFAIFISVAIQAFVTRNGIESFEASGYYTSCIGSCILLIHLLLNSIRWELRVFFLKPMVAIFWMADWSSCVYMEAA